MLEFNMTLKEFLEYIWIKWPIQNSIKKAKWKNIENVHRPRDE